MSNIRKKNLTHPLSLLALLLTPLVANGAEKPNIIVMMMDDLGVNDLGVYTFPSLENPGPPPLPAPKDGTNSLPAPNRAMDPASPSGSLTPRIDSLATEGVLFTQFYATHSVCSPTRASLMTGSYATRVGMESVVGPYSGTTGITGLNSTEVTLPELLRTRGYATSMTGKWHLGHRLDFNPVRHGFETYFGILYSSDMWTGNEYNSSWPELELMQGEQPLASYTTSSGHTINGPIDTIEEQALILEAITEKAIEDIGNAVEANKPFFLYYAPHTPHVPVHPHPDFLSTEGQTDPNARYDDLLKEIDFRVGEILDKLDTLGVTNNTVVIFTSDNGPWETRPGSGDLYQGTGSRYPYRGWKNSTWEGGHRVPFLVKFPNAIPAGEIRHQLATTIDIYTTLAELAGATTPPYGVIDGLNIWPLLTGSNFSEPHQAFYYYDAGRNSAEAVIDLTTTDKWKLVNTSSGPSHDGLFRIGDAFTGDFQELSNLKNTFSSTASNLQTMLNGWNSGMARRESGRARSVSIAIDKDSLTIDEGGEATLNVRLSSSANQTIHVGRYYGDDNLNVSSGNEITFTTTNWNIWQPVTLNFTPDLDTEDGMAVFRVFGNSMYSSQDIHVREVFVWENDTQVAVTPISPPDNTLKVHYLLDEKSGTLIADSSISNNNGSLSGTNATTWSQGKKDGGLLFNQNSLAHIDTSSSISADDTTGLSACAWVWMQETPTSENLWILQQLDGSGVGRTWLAVNPSNQLYSYVGGAPSSGGFISTKEWHHVAVTAGNGHVKLYLDGQLVSTLDNPIESNNAVFRFANHKLPTSTIQWHGILDDLRIYDGTLEDDEILWLATDKSLSPKISTEIIQADNEYFIAITYEQFSGGTGTIGANYSVDDIKFTVQTSLQLEGGWTNDPAQLELVRSPIPVDPFKESVKLRFLDPINGFPLFMRLKVSRE